MTYRHRRHPLRPWSEYQWKLAKQRQDIRERRTDGKATDDEARVWTEKLQLVIGDHCWQGQIIEKDKWRYGKDKKTAKKIYDRPEEEHMREKGRVERHFAHGFPITFPEPSEDDLKKFKPYARSKHFLPFRGVHDWHPWARWDNLKTAQEEADAEEEKRGFAYQRYVTWWTDVRRVYACALALAAFALHIGLLCE